MTFDAAALKYWEQRGEHAGSSKEIWTNLTRLVSWIGKSTMLSEIDDALLAELVTRRRAEHRWGEPKHGLVTNAQVNRSVTQLLKRILTRARKAWKIPLPDEPDWREHMLPERDRVRELDFEEEARIEKSEREDYRPARLFALATALRRREIVSLTWRQVDWAGGVIRVVGKGDKPHEIPITPEITEILWPLRDHDPTHVFTFVAQRTRTCGKTGRKYVKGNRYPITYWGLGTRFRRDLAKAGVENFRLHDLRHTGATRTLRASKNIRAVQDLLNHSSLTVTQRYAHALKDDVAEAMKARRDDEIQRRAEHESRKKSRNNPEAQAS
ncbi:tyrosine-type recombinase/integrase [Microvirga massiliensis]|uniref:tyrosine-type recombinase/integrase n=1 Tax=Microvirga massiliensis TaxID=1033741 RepID=UPI003CC7C676